MSIDLGIIAIVFTIILILVFFSAVILYLSFRIKATFRKDTSRGAKIALTVFLIGILFLAGAILYYSALTLTAPGQTDEPTPTNSGGQPTPTPSQVPTQTPIQTVTPTPSQGVTFTAFYPSSATMGSQVTLQFTIINPSSSTYDNTVIQTNNLFQSFIVISSTEPIIGGNTIQVGNLPPGTTTVTLQLTSPSRPGTVTDTANLIYQGIQSQLSQQISITVRGK